MTSIRALTATAVRWANVIYDRLPDDRARDAFAALWVDLEREVDKAETAGDLALAAQAISRWRDTVHARFLEADRG